MSGHRTPAADMRICRCKPAPVTSGASLMTFDRKGSAEVDSDKPSTVGGSLTSTDWLTSTNQAGSSSSSSDSCDDDWSWNSCDSSGEVILYGPWSRTALFHPGWSSGTAAVRGSKPLLPPEYAEGSASYYWEIDVSHRVFGTSLMFGICTRKASLYDHSFVNIVGQDGEGWAINHKGEAWHDGRCRPFTRPFPENTPTTIGCLLDWNDGPDGSGTLSFFKDDRFLGVAFRNLRQVLERRRQAGQSDEVYPVISSTASRTEMTLSFARRRMTSLRDRCVWTVARCMIRRPFNVDDLELPQMLRDEIRRRVSRSYCTN